MTELKHKVVKIKKPRRCHGCNEKFEAGSEMIYYVGIFEGDFSTSYWCKPCNAYVIKYSNDFEDGIGYGELKGEEHYEKFKEEFILQNSVWL